MSDTTNRQSVDAGESPVTIKKYANRRLYNTATSSYVTLETLCQMVKDGVDFVVYDAKTSDDITRSVLTQIIFEEESKVGQSLLPIRFLRNLIRYYGDNLQTLVPGYLEMSMESFTRNQTRLREQMESAWRGELPFRAFEEMARQNQAMFDNALKAMLAPFTGAAAASGTGNSIGGGDAKEAPAAPAKSGGESRREIAELRAEVEAMRQRIARLAGGE